MDVVNESRPHPLFRAAVLSGSEPLVRMHIARGRDVNARDELGLSLLALAASRGHFTTAKLLLEAGANAASKDFKGRDPQEIARQNGFFEIAELLSSVRTEDSAAAEPSGFQPDLGEDCQTWQEGASPVEPAGDPAYVAKAIAIDARIADFEYLNPDETLDDVEADLPEHHLSASIRNREFQSIRADMLEFFSTAIAAGAVSERELNRLSDKFQELEDDPREHLERVLEELGIEIVSAGDRGFVDGVSAPVGDSELELIEDATAYFGTLWSPALDSYWLFMRDVGCTKLLTADDEVRLGEAIEALWTAINYEICGSPQAIEMLCTASDEDIERLSRTPMSQRTPYTYQKSSLQADRRCESAAAKERYTSREQN